jgi:hypothetical protein
MSGCRGIIAGVHIKELSAALPGFARGDGVAGIKPKTPTFA